MYVCLKNKFLVSNKLNENYFLKWCNNFNFWTYEFSQT